MNKVRIAINGFIMFTAILVATFISAIHASAYEYSLPLDSYGITNSFYGSVKWNETTGQFTGSYLHGGLDMEALTPKDVKAITSGKIVWAGWERMKDGSYAQGGRTLTLLGEDGTYYYYAHLSSYVKTSGEVKAGEVIAKSGSSSYGKDNNIDPHLHVAIGVSADYAKNKLANEYRINVNVNGSSKPLYSLNTVYMGVGNYCPIDPETFFYLRGLTTKNRWKVAYTNSGNNSGCNGNHTWNSGKVTKSATYSAAGVKTYTCTKCGATKTEKIPALNNTTATSCACTTSNKGWYKVKTGGANLNFYHNFESSNGGEHEATAGTYLYVTKAYTGSSTNYLKIGHVSYVNNEKQNAEVYVAMSLLTSVSASEVCTNIGHTWGSWTTTKDSTCAATGTKERKCTRCSKVETDTIAKKTTHTWNNGAVTTAAKCNAEGVKTYTCTVCGTTKTESISPTGNHTWNSGVVTKNATCASQGVKTYTCTVCSTTKTEAIAKDVSNHTGWNSGIVTTTATCAREGVMTYTCSGCNATRTESIPKSTTHTWNAGVVTTNATCVSQGVKTYTCTVCGTTINEATAIDSSVHRWGSGIVIKEPTFEAYGTRRYTCLDCSVTRDENIAPIDNPVRHEGDSICLSGRIEYNYYVSLDASLVGNPNAYMQFTGNGISKKCSDFIAVTKNGRTVYQYTVELNASQMTEIVTVQFIANDKVYLSDTISVAYYAGIILENTSGNSDYASAQDVVRAMLNYGGYAQQYFGVNTGILANTGIYDGSGSANPAIDANVFKNETKDLSGIDVIPSNSQLKFVGASLVCKSVTEMKFYYEMAAPISANSVNDVYRITAFGTNNISMKVDGKILVITVTNINASELDDINAISITRKDNAMSPITFTYSPLSYMVSANTKDSNSKLAIMMRAMYYYNQEVSKYVSGL